MNSKSKFTLSISTFADKPLKPVIRDGIYQAEILGVDIQKQFSRTKLLIQANIKVESELENTLTYFANIKVNETGQILAPTSTMALTKTLYNLFPDKNITQINLKELIGMKCYADVSTVTLDYRKKEKDPSQYYSKISQFYHNDNGWEQVVPET
jgi:hypothetical protein